MSLITPDTLIAPPSRLPEPSELAKVSPFGWLAYTSPAWKPYPWLEIVDYYFRRAMDPDYPTRKFALSAPPQHGKLLSHDTLVPTPLGFVRHGELRPGDEVYSPNGRPVEITSVGNDGFANVEMEFTDGEIVTCHENHEWLVYDRTGHRGYRVIEAKELLTRNLTEGKKKPRYVVQIDYAKPLSGTRVDLPIDPYVLGVWLGDGSSSKGQITFAKRDKSIVQEVICRGYVKSSEWIHSTTGVHTVQIIGLRKQLRHLNLLDNKHIPEIYQLSSISQRRDLLGGLIDTDGCVSQDGSVRFINCNERLVDDVIRLVRSLGYYAGVQCVPPTTSSSGIVGKQYVYQVRFTPHDGKLHTVLKRKKWAKKKSLRRRRAIKSVRVVPPRPGRCISVNSNDGLYLVTDHLIPTHNSHYSCVGVPSFTVGKFPDKRGMLILHSTSLAKRFGKQCRDLIRTYGKEIWDVTIDPETRAKEEWAIKGHRGGMECVGIKTGISGRTADWAVFDDPFPSYKDSQSGVYRDFVWNFYLNDLRPRMSSDGWIVLLQTRWNDDDLIGRIKKGMSDEQEEWEFINLPAIAEEEEFFPDGRHFRSPGEPLCPELKPLEFLEEQKRVMEPPRWATLYQGSEQRPVGVKWGAEHFGNHVFVQKWPKDIRWAVAFLDPAMGKDSKGDDFQAVVYIGVRSGNNEDDMPNPVFYVDADIFHETVDDMCQRAVEFAVNHPRLPIYFFVEEVGFQSLLIKPLSKLLKQLGLYRDMHMEGLKVHTGVDKLRRITNALSEPITQNMFRYVQSKGTALLVNQLRNLGSSASKKDGPDAFAGAMKTFDRLASDLKKAKE